MRFSGTFTPEQIELLARVLERHCSAHGIATALEKEDAARGLLSFWQTGLSSAESMLNMLEERLRGKASTC